MCRGRSELGKEGSVLRQELLNGICPRRRGKRRGGKEERYEVTFRIGVELCVRRGLDVRRLGEMSQER